MKEFEAYLKSLLGPIPEEQRRIMWAVFSITALGCASGASAWGVIVTG